VVLFYNKGAMLGIFSDLPAVLRVVTLSTGGAFLVCTYAIIQYLLPIKSIRLRMGMSFLLGGILGNVTDRVLWGHVIDFIIIGNAKISTAVFNLADALQWVGYGLIVIAIIRDGELLWPEKDTRKMRLVNPKYQLRYSFLLVGVGLSLTLVGAVYSYTYLRVTILELIGNNEHIARKFLFPFIITYVIICGAFSGILFVLGRYLSHRIAGPIYAFEKFVEDIISGKDRHLKLRAGDEFRSLEELAEKLKPYLLKIDDTAEDPKSNGAKPLPENSQ
jgi:signal peptidase II